MRKNVHTNTHIPESYLPGAKFTGDCSVIKTVRFARMDDGKKRYYPSLRKVSRVKFRRQKFAVWWNKPKEDMKNVYCFY